MTIRSFEGIEPTVHDTAHVDEAAVVIGDVTIEAKANLWPNVTVRGDTDPIVIREGANLQDNAVCHEAAEVGPYATVGHSAIVHAATVGRRAMVGMNAVVLDDAEIGEESLVGAGSVVTEGTTVPPGTLVAGAPATVVKEVDDSPWTEASDHYVELARRHAETSERLE